MIRQNVRGSVARRLLSRVVLGIALSGVLLALPACESRRDADAVDSNARVTTTDTQSDDTTAATPANGTTGAPVATAVDDVASNTVTNADQPAAADTTARHMEVTAQGLREYLHKYQGKVVYLDFWATWCAPCVESLPELAELQRKYGDRGLQVIAISFDSGAFLKKVPATLDKAGWNGPSLVVSDPDEQNALVEWLGSDWRSELPARFILDRQGNRTVEITETLRPTLPPLEELIEGALK